MSLTSSILPVPTGCPRHDPPSSEVAHRTTPAQRHAAPDQLLTTGDQRPAVGGRNGWRSKSNARDRVCEQRDLMPKELLEGTVLDGYGGQDDVFLFTPDPRSPGADFGADLISTPERCTACSGRCSSTPDFRSNAKRLPERKGEGNLLKADAGTTWSTRSPT
ncbi:hypothetical protein Arub01_15550 [Actinomadura rubrobrunea]|uniref:Uncharacterized protein n=1 Tax=Actinomadura rubrobrunea TaxID=115335 RepID=A0A9W6PU84_9ACTN|nr:hypothetical protein Arub01_15550 [Actinomadura rubrobrunea]